MSNIPNSGSGFESWVLADEDGAPSTSLMVQLRRRALVLPYRRFLYAQGNDSQVQIAFASHLITVTGHGLASLLTALAAQQALWLIQPAESEVKVDNPGSTTGEPTSPSISKIAIEPFQ
jgi:hypothetical protein